MVLIRTLKLLALVAGIALLGSLAVSATAQETPTSLLPDGEPAAGTAAEPGVYRWEGLALGDYAIGATGEMPANLAGLRVTDASGAPLQNPVLRLEGMSPDAAYHYFYFRAE